ncbi:MAG: hypothetical protein H0U12_01505 [Thermoleophilaceae bacterium]|nr:hypothetical protein [Thermoleophilaceae bacterium]
MRVTRQRLSPQRARSRVAEWLDQDVVWIPQPCPRHIDILGGLIAHYDPRSDLIADAQLAALAIEHGRTVCPPTPTSPASPRSAGRTRSLSGGPDVT